MKNEETIAALPVLVLSLLFVLIHSFPLKLCPSQLDCSSLTLPQGPNQTCWNCFRRPGYAISFPIGNMVFKTNRSQIISFHEEVGQDGGVDICSVWLHERVTVIQERLHYEERMRGTTLAIRKEGYDNWRTWRNKKTTE
jgi:hypothetical protein